MPKRPCLDCGTLTTNPSRCDEHQQVWQQRQDRIRGSARQRGYGSAWQRLSTQVLKEHRALHGDWCPGWQVDAHQATALTVDHIVPKSAGGTDHRTNLQVLCRFCNSRKGSRQ